MFTASRSPNDHGRTEHRNRQSPRSSRRAGSRPPATWTRTGLCSRHYLRPANQYTIELPGFTVMKTRHRLFRPRTWSSDRRARSRHASADDATCTTTTAAMTGLLGFLTPPFYSQPPGSVPLIPTSAHANRSGRRCAPYSARACAGPNDPSSRIVTDNPRSLIRTVIACGTQTRRVHLRSGSADLRGGGCEGVEFVQRHGPADRAG